VGGGGAVRAARERVSAVEEPQIRDEVERRLDRSFEAVQEQLTELLDLEWEEVEVVVNTHAHRQEISEADVIVSLIGKAERPPTVHARIRRSMIRWIGKPWRERENPWDRYKHRIPDPPKATEEADDLEEWTPYRPEEHE
jgi:hypothetical protein